MDKLQRILKLVFIITVLFYVVFTAIYIINIPIGKGDEQLFINDLNLIDSQGWIAAIKKNISIPYMLLAYPLTFLFKKYIALRITSLFLTFGLGVYFWKRNNPSVFFFISFLFYLFSTIFFFYGTNDALFSVSITIFLNEVFLLNKNKSFNSNIAFIALIVAFFTRVLTFVYLPILLLAFFVIYKQRNQISLKFLYPLLVMIVLLIINIPSLKENGKLSYDLKSPPKSVEVTWIQRQYLSQILVNKGELKNGKHPTWRETQNYININGEKSLPKGISESLYFDIKMTIKEFFKDLLYASISTFRQLGFIFILIVLLPLMSFLKTKKFEYNMFIPVSLIIMLSVFSLIIISNVELRWLAPVFVMALIWYFDLEENKMIPGKLVIINYSIFIALAGYGGLQMFNKII